MLIAAGGSADEAAALNARISASKIVVTAASNEENRLFVTQRDGKVKVLDQGFRAGVGGDWITPTAGTGCTATAPVSNPVTGTVQLGYVTCPVAGITGVEVTLGDLRGNFAAFNGDWTGSVPNPWTGVPVDALELPLTVTAGAGGDTMAGTPSAQNTFYAGPSGSGMSGGPYRDVMHGGPGQDGMAGGPGDDDLQGLGGEDHLRGGEGTDTLDGGADADDVVADAGGADILTGGSGDDRCALSYPSGAGVQISLDGVANDGARDLARAGNVRQCEAIGGTQGPDVLIGTDGDDRITADLCCGYPPDDRQDNVQGLGGDDTIENADGDAVIDAGPGDDRITGGTGDDDVRGGTGVDTFAYDTNSEASAPVVADLDGAVGDDGRPALGERDSLGSDVEHLIALYGDDVLSGNARDNVLNGRAGLDAFDGKGGRDFALLSPPGPAEIRLDLETTFVDRSDRGLPEVQAPLRSIEDVRSGEYDDLLVGVDGAANMLDGGSGNDTLDGGTGPDDLRGDAGLDFVSYEERTDAVAVDLAQPQSAGSPGEGDSLQDIEAAAGGAGADTLLGNERFNILVGGPGPDVLNPRGDEDEVYGDAGTDAITTTDAYRDDVECGPDGATLTADAFDLLDDACPLPGQTGPTGPPATLPSPVLTTTTTSSSPSPLQRPRPAPVPSRAPAAPPAPAPALDVDLNAPHAVSRLSLRRGRLVVKARCSSACRMTAELEATGSNRRLLRASASGAAGRWVAIPLRTGRSGPRTGRRDKGLRVRLRVTSAQRQAAVVVRKMRLLSP